MNLQVFITSGRDPRPEGDPSIQFMTNRQKNNINIISLNQLNQCKCYINCLFCEQNSHFVKCLPKSQIYLKVLSNDISNDLILN